MGFELGLRNFVNPRAHDLAQDLAARLTSDRIGDDPDGVLRFDEAEWHCSSDSGIQTPGKGKRWSGRSYDAGARSGAAPPSRTDASETERRPRRLQCVGGRLGIGPQTEPGAGTGLPVAQAQVKRLQRELAGLRQLDGAALQQQRIADP